MPGFRIKHVEEKWVHFKQVELQARGPLKTTKCLKCDDCAAHIGPHCECANRCRDGNTMNSYLFLGLFQLGCGWLGYSFCRCREGATCLHLSVSVYLYVIEWQSVYDSWVRVMSHQRVRDEIPQWRDSLLGLQTWSGNRYAFQDLRATERQKEAEGRRVIRTDQLVTVTFDDWPALV